MVPALLLSVGLSLSACHTEHYASEQPASPAVVKPAPPPGNVIFVEPGYQWKNGAYVVVPGHYIKVKTGRTWIPGKWEKKPGGFVWIPGHWK